MARRIFIKVIGFSTEERHALNTLFRLSEDAVTTFSPWSAGAPHEPSLVLLDGQSYEARLEAESPANAELPLLWIGDDPPPQAWRSFPRPLHWPEVIEAMDGLFNVSELEFDPDLAELAEVAANRHALIVSPSPEHRLYLRARMALVQLTQADEAESGAQALELARGMRYDLAVVDCGIPDMDAWALLRQLRSGPRPIAHTAITKERLSWPDRLRAWLAGVELLMERAPDPNRLEAWLLSL